ncbi:hypothetical protein FGO68_gene15473 [Halteria grandinella]|uniref:deoxyhypusine synthase n=1 Tax=Halteria grandinella TaxID=5974 RepID=A0A8J8NSX3_HALGN|nr:hypothetical protein FGO68_gene15473 [Halteria grandinella]
MSLYAAANERLDAFTGPTSLDRPEVKGYDLNQGLNYSKMWQTLSHTGFQATNLGKAIDRVNQMIKWRLSHEPVTADTPAHLRDPEVRENVRCTIFLGYTSNMSSCGMREYIRYLCQHKMVDAIVTTCGGIEEDFMKCMTPFYIGDFYLKGKTLRSEGINRTGNLLVPMKNYHTLQDWMGPIMKQMHKEQTENGTVWSPSKIINRLGKEINNEESVYYWCWKNDIPVFSPAITDGEIGDIIFDHTYTNGPGFVVDIAQDVVKINEIALRAHKSGILIVGGGVIKHHICNAQIRRGGADLSVYVNTAVDYDGSDSGATPDEAVSWGKISDKAEPVKIWAEATLVLPTLIGETFARNFDLAKRT